MVIPACRHVQVAKWAHHASHGPYGLQLLPGGVSPCPSSPLAASTIAARGSAAGTAAGTAPGTAAGTPAAVTAPVDNSALVSTSTGASLENIETPSRSVMDSCHCVT